MAKELMMGNHAIALGAIRAGVGVVSGYPGTPSTEVLETVAKYNPGDIYVEWSVNEKAALEVAAGAAYTGKRSMVTMKQVGLNACADPVMSLSYIGVKGGMVIVVADDPGPISSQTEQDTRYFAGFAKLPVFDPVSPEEAYEMVQDAFEYSEKYETPVILRPTTRICHGCVTLDVDDVRREVKAEGFKKDDSRWVIFPRTSYLNHIKLEERYPKLADDFSTYRFNELTGKGQIGIVASGDSYMYAKEALQLLGVEQGAYKLLKVATAYPFPQKLALEFLEGLQEVIVLEELEPVLERELLQLCGKEKIQTTIRGKLTKDVPIAGENTVVSVKKVLKKLLEKYMKIENEEEAEREEAPVLPIRPPVLCAGCPHRASFYAVKQAMKGKKAVFTGDIGCYTLGNAAPLGMVDTCLCMGAGVTMAQGLHRAEPDGIHIAFIGDATFFHTGISGVVNAVYNQTKMVLVVLDNSTTAMTGHQPHPGTGMTMMGDVAEKISIPKILEAIGVKSVVTVDPLNLKGAISAVQEAAECEGVSAVIFKAPCVAVAKATKKCKVEEDICIGCQKCLKEIGCPALQKIGKKVVIDQGLCNGCGLCTEICPVHAIGGEGVC